MRLKLAFTIVELLVVITILGVLAAATVPKIISNIDVSKAGEAYNALGTFSKQAVLCVQTHQYKDFSQGCFKFSDFTNYSASDTLQLGNFTYHVDSAMGGQTMTLEINACLKSDCSDNNFIGIQIDPDNNYQVGYIYQGIFAKKQ